MTLIGRIESAIASSFGPAAEAIPAPEWNACLSAAARAVLEELQNPSEAMNDAGARSAYDRVVDLDPGDAGVIFSAMIDAALVDGA